MEEQRLDLTLFSEKIERLRHEIAQVIVGQEHWPHAFRPRR